MSFSIQSDVGSMIRFTSDVASNGVKCMIYGGAGMGKTRIIASAPTPLYLSAEGGLLSVKKFNLPYLSVNSMDVLLRYYQWLYAAQDNYAFQTIGIDSASEIAETILAAEMKTNKDPRKAYGELAIQMMNALRAFRDLPYRNVVFTAKMGRITDQQTGAIMWGPMMPGLQLDQQVPYMFDEVFHLGNHRAQDGSEFSAIRTKGDNQYQAKDRSGMLDYWEQPDLTSIFNKIAKV